MARGDGIHRTSARNVTMNADKIGNTQKHNEREKESYVNQDIVLDREPYNIHFKFPTGSYTEMFAQMVKDGAISTRGLKEDAKTYGELIFDVNSAYFHNHGGYEFAKQFYADAYKAAIEIVGGEQFILSAVMHADERNRAMSEALGHDVYHYHLHVVYVPVVEKQILWSKRCKDKSLVGTVKETIMQVSASKKWLSKPALDEKGEPILSKSGKPVLKKSYSVLQDDFFNAMRSAGYTDVERGERGSTEEHLTVTQFKVEQEQKRLAAVEVQVRESEKALATNTAAAKKKKQELVELRKETKMRSHAAVTIQDIEAMGKKNPLTGNISMTQSECDALKRCAINGIAAKVEIAKLKDKLSATEKLANTWKQRYETLREKFEELKKEVQPYLDAVKLAPERVRAFLDAVITKTKHTKLQKEPVHRRGQDMEI